MTLIIDLDLDILMTCLHTEEVCRSRLSTVTARTKQTDGRDRTHYHAAFADADTPDRYAGSHFEKCEVA